MNVRRLEVRCTRRLCQPRSFIIFVTLDSPGGTLFSLSKRATLRWTFSRVAMSSFSCGSDITLSHTAILQLRPYKCFIDSLFGLRGEFVWANGKEDRVCYWILFWWSGYDYSCLGLLLPPTLGTFLQALKLQVHPACRTSAMVSFMGHVHHKAFGFVKSNLPCAFSVVARKDVFLKLERITRTLTTKNEKQSSAKRRILTFLITGQYISNSCLNNHQRCIANLVCLSRLL